MKIEEDTKLDFSDVLIRPKRSVLSSRSEVNLIRQIKFANGISWEGVPIIAANMDTIGTYEVYKVLSEHKIITALHKFYTLEDYKSMNLDPNYFMVSTGITDNDFNRVTEII